MKVSFEEKNDLIFMKIDGYGRYRLDQVINCIFIAKEYDSLIISARDKAKEEGKEDVRQVLNSVLTDVRNKTEELGLNHTNEIEIDFANYDIDNQDDRGR